ncbi:MAG: phage tail protein, partial [Gammaproteobacteria bacterium]|nr:phage tail protein [Gammaproteobacteria bacterium]
DWIRIAQPELLLNHTSGNEAFQFQVDVLNAKKVDIEITIELNEAVDIAEDGTAAYRPEPVLETGFDDVPAGTALDAITIGGEALFP